MTKGFENNPELTTVGFELSCSALPFERILELLDFLPYGSQMRTAWEFLLLTGCRMSEMDAFEINGPKSFIKGNYAFWRCGKNQKGKWRKEYLPTAWLEEYDFFLRTHRGIKNKLFPSKSDTLSREFNKNVRPKLSEAWTERTATAQRKGIHEYVLQMKGCRKTFATVIFWQEWARFKDANVAMNMTCKRLRHSHTGMTVDHYIENSNRLNMEKWAGYAPAEILALSTQRHVGDYAVSVDNRQAALQDFML